MRNADVSVDGALSRGAGWCWMFTYGNLVTTSFSSKRRATLSPGIRLRGLPGVSSKGFPVAGHPTSRFAWHGQGFSRSKDSLFAGHPTSRFARRTKGFSLPRASDFAVCLGIEVFLFLPQERFRNTPERASLGSRPFP